MENRTIGHAGVREILEDLDMVAIAGVEHHGALRRFAPRDLLGAPEDLTVKAQGAFPVAGLHTDVMKTASAENRVRGTHA